MTIYDYKVLNAKGEEIQLNKYQGKVLLIVNTATKCGHTPQYAGLESLYEKYRDKGFEILDFPCNQFLHQAPGSEKEIKEFCTLNYNTQFELFKKINVNGKDEEPLYTYLKKEMPGPKGEKIQWNFTKFLIDRNGNIVKRFEPAETPDKIEPSINEII